VELRDWDKRYRASEAAGSETPTPLVARIAAGMKAGRALDLACGAGRNAVWLAEQGWKVAAVDGSAAAIEIVRRRSAAALVSIDAWVADLEKGEFAIEEGAWDLILMCCYLQRDLFEPVKAGVVEGGVVIAMVLLREPKGERSRFRMMPGELRNCFRGWEILHDHEGAGIAEIAARKLATDEHE
jgi:tellurite methyltransferase